FQTKTIIITGAGGNFGREGCIFFICRGANVAALDVNEAALKETLDEVNGVGCSIKGYTCDVTSSDSVDDTVQSIVRDFGQIDMLWNNAGYQGQIKPTLEYDPADFARVMNINVTGMFLVLQRVAKQSDGDGGGSASTVSHPFTIVNTASVAALRGTPAMVAYSSSKAAILAMTVSCAKDLAPHGIRVNAISPALIGPGFIGSPYFASDPEEVAKAKIGGVPMKRLGTLEEVIKSVAYLLSDDSSYSTGTNLVVDGG
ncbi:hypothetical protein THAPSDRAFT_264109, partial [Thalassiosira pseudonana CCMP1335]